MREIKFRAWDKWKNKMIQPHSGDFIAWHAMSNWKECLDVMQFTGLHDKNGKEIYEGDIITSPSKNKYRIEYVWDRFQPCTREPSTRYVWCDNAWWRDCEVIGNIYENPELLNSSGAGEG